MNERVIYRCSYCRQLMFGQPHHEGIICPSCASGMLLQVSRLTETLLVDAETAR